MGIRCNNPSKTLATQNIAIIVVHLGELNKVLYKTALSDPVATNVMWLLNT